MGKLRISKLEADCLKKIKIWRLKKAGMLNGGFSGTRIISWGSPDSEDRSRIQIGVLLGSEEWENYAHFQYIQTDQNGEKENFDYKIKLDTT